MAKTILVLTESVAGSEEDTAFDYLVAGAQIYVGDWLVVK
jgi:hypothetical protein